MFKFMLVKSNPSWLVDNDGKFIGFASESIISRHRTIEAAEKAQCKADKHPNTHCSRIISI